MEALLAVWANIGPWIEALSLLMAGATAIVALTPTPKDDALVAKVYKVISWVSGNLGYNK